MNFRLTLFLLTLFLGSFIVFSQQNLIATSSFYKDKLFSPFNSTSFSNGSFLPICESQFNLNKKIQDTSKQYYQYTAYLFKKHLFEIKGDDYYLTLSPVLDYNLGRDKNDSLGSRLIQNTRGFFIEGDLGKSFSFSSSFYENQSQFNNYEKAYYLSAGELTPNGKVYVSDNNAVIPGGARTKPFKIDGFDYAYAIGNVVYSPSKRLQIIGGNNSHFIGSGYRSLLLSDNSVYTPYIRMNIKISEKWSFVYLRTRLLNLMRRPIHTTVEAYYEPKGFSVNYLTYKASDKFNISLFEGIVWSKGDSVASTKVNSLYYNPIPGVSEIFVTDHNKMNSLLGLNAEYLINSKHRVYSQLAMSNLNDKYLAFQLGYRGYNFEFLKNFMLQLEYNNVPTPLYTSPNSRLNYSNYNLPLAHTKGNGFQEYIIRSNYEYRRFYIDLKIIVYQLNGFRNGSLLAVDNKSLMQIGTLQHDQIEIGYRFNRKLNLSFFGSYIFRNDLSTPEKLTKFFNVGIRTGLINHYNDF